MVSPSSLTKEKYVKAETWGISLNDILFSSFFPHVSHLTLKLSALPSDIPSDVVLDGLSTVAMDTIAPEDSFISLFLLYLLK